MICYAHSALACQRGELGVARIVLMRSPHQFQQHILTFGPLHQIEHNIGAVLAARNVD
jgi:hypothetical protein